VDRKLALLSSSAEGCWPSEITKEEFALDTFYGLGIKIARSSSEQNVYSLLIKMTSWRILKHYFLSRMSSINPSLLMDYESTDRADYTLLALI
jgi:hypothetical protein